VPSLTDKDASDLEFAIGAGVDAVALSFVRNAEDVRLVKDRITAMGADTWIIAKLEKPQAIDNLDEILEVADGVMVARGDLGVEMPPEKVPAIQKLVIRRASDYRKPVITATQMLESMIDNPRPTRAEASDVANAIYDGTDAVMLSQESAVGQYPVESVAMLASIAERTERELPYANWLESRVRRDARDPAYTMAYSACQAARELSLDAIVTPTLSGRSARLVSAHRPSVPIFALSPGRETVRRCGLIWGVEAASMRRHEVTESLIADACRRVVELGWVKPGSRIAITAGLPSGRPGTTSMLQIQRV
jgi:pyruvate kinase